MNDFMVYIFKSAIWITVFYGIYRLFFRNETFFRFNRTFLLTGMVASFVLALFQLHYRVEIMNFSLPEMRSTPAIINDVIPTAHFDWMNFFFLIYMAVSFSLFLYYGFELNKVRRLIRKLNTSTGEKSNLIYTPAVKSPFSFFGYVFMNPKTKLQDIEKELILTHETAHIKQHHWIDILLAQLVCIFQWFNPFAWLYLNAVKQNHEFLADRSVIENGYSPAVYQAVLINSTFNFPIFTFTNSFASINKFKRITIMKKNISKPVKKLAVLLLLPAFAGFLAAFAKPEYHFTVLPSQPETETLAPQDTIEKAADSQSSAKVVTFKQSKTVQTKNSLPPLHKIEDSGNTNNEVQVGTSTTCDTIQTVEVSGQVLDTDGKPIAGAAIVENGGTRGTVTDMDGNFILSLPNDKDKNLKISYFNKETVIIPLKSNTKGKLISMNVKVELKESTEKPKQFETVKSTENSKTEVIIGKADSIVVIGAGSMNKKNSPLFIVDGKEYPSSLNNLNSLDIESITVLKDEPATSLYGEKGKNGVVIIKTKKATP